MVSSFSDVRKRTAKGRTVDVIDLEPLAMIEPKEKGNNKPSEVKDGVQHSTGRETDDKCYEGY